MMRRREEEAEAELVDGIGDARGLLLECEAERLEHVRGAACGRDRAVAVFRDGGAGCGCNERGRGRDVDRLRAVAAGACRVDQVVAPRLHREHVCAHRLRAAGDLVRRLALRAERDQEPPDLCGRRGAFHDLVHDVA
jgi:hypothetical protein